MKERNGFRKEKVKRMNERQKEQRKKEIKLERDRRRKETTGYKIRKEGRDKRKKDERKKGLLIKL